MFKVFLTVIFMDLLLLDISYVDSFGKRRCRQQKVTTQERNFYNPLTDSKDDCIDPYCNCGSVGFGIVQQIPYSPVTSSCDPINVQFSSACIRCGLCLAVAEQVSKLISPWTQEYHESAEIGRKFIYSVFRLFQINQTLIETHDMMKPDQWLNDNEASSVLKAICDHAFRHFSLREISGKRYICDRIPGATLVTSSADGLWEIKYVVDAVIFFLFIVKRKVVLYC
ncbi:uncharacterized protein LOC125501347 [Athalia rosae]|uniref:uncharacterized protein LOC125501347 n=1 Tax=Athalia rosae TaxID=37344 RepID=UPI002033F814|nr:uncharacterized protein LOC125501347 [Athalia rosae]